jgi:hypothetical protein
MQQTTGDSQRIPCNVTRCDVGQATGSARHAAWDTAASNRNQTTQRENVRHATNKGHADTIPRAACCRRPLEHVQHATMHTTDDMQHATGKMHLTTCSVKQKTSRQHAACSGQHAANNKQAARNGQRATCPNTSCNMQRALTPCNATDTMQRATGSGQQTSWKRQQTACNGQQGNKATGNMQHGADIAQKTAKPGDACNRQRASDSRRHARGREHMRVATGTPRHCRISCAASSGRRTSSSMRKALYSTTSAQHGTDATHKMPHTTGAAACNKHTRNRQHAAGKAMHGMRRPESGRSRTSRLRGLWITAGKGLRAPKVLRVP